MKKRKVLLTLLVFVAINFSVGAQQSQGFKTILQTGHSETILGIRISPSGQYAASYASDNTVILWDLTLLKQVGIQRTEGMPKIAEFSADEKYLYVYDGYNGLIQWNTDNGQVNEILPKGSGNVLKCYLWKDSESIVALTNDEFNVVELKTGNIIKSKKVDRYKEQISTLLVSEKQDILMAERDLYGKGHRIEIYDLATLELKQEIPFWADALVFNEELNTIVALDHENNDLVFISLDDMSQERIKTSFAHKLVMSPNQSKLVVLAYKNILSQADASLYDLCGVAMRILAAKQIAEVVNK